MEILQNSEDSDIHYYSVKFQYLSNCSVLTRPDMAIQANNKS